MRKRFAVITSIAAAVNVGVIALILVHPLGYLSSIGIGVALLVIVGLLLSRMGKPFRNPEIEKLVTDLLDEHLKGTDDPHEPARWVP